MTVSGDAKARLLPFPSVTFENVRVGDADKPLVVADRFSMDAELAPFLSGEVLIYDMRLENPVITLDLDERGLPNWTLPKDGPVKPTHVTLENARIINGTMTLNDASAGRTWKMENFNAAVKADSLYGPYRIDGDADLNGTPMGFKFSTGALSKDGFSVRTGLDLPSAGIELSVDGRVAAPKDASTGPYTGTFTVKPLTVTADNRYVVTGKFSASPREVAIDEYRAEFGDPADPYVVNGTAGISGGTDPRYHVEVKGTQMTLPQEQAGAQADATPQGAAPSFSSRLARVQAILSALPFPPVPGSIDVDLPAVVAGDTTIRSIRLAASPDEGEGRDARRRWKVTNFTAELPGRTTIEADGVLQLPLSSGNGADNQPGFSGNLLIASRQPSGLATWLTGTADEPIRRLENAGVAAKIDVTPLRQDVQDLEVILGPARMRGSLTRVSDPARRSTLAVKLAGEAIDFDTLQALGAVFVGQDGAARFADHDLDVTLDLKQPDISGVKLDGLQASIRSRDEKTEIDRLSITGLYGAAVSATGSLDRRSDGVHAGVDATVTTDDGAQLAAGLSQRFPDIAPLSSLAAIAMKNGADFADTRLDVVGALAFKEKLSGEASLSVSGETGGTNLSVTTTAKGNVEKPDEASVQLNALFDSKAAERLFAQLGLPTFPVETAGPARLEASMDGSLFKGMQTTVTLTGDDMSAEWKGVTTSDILSTGFTGQMQIESADIEPWLTTLGYALPGMGLGTEADIGASFSWRKSKAVLRSIDAVFNGTRATGELTVDASGAIPQVRGQLQTEFLDASQLFSVISGDPSAAILDADPTEALDQEFRPPILPDNDLEIALGADEMALPGGGRSLTGVKGTLIYRGGEMALRDTTASFGGGTVGGLVSLQNADGAMVLNAQVQARDVDVGALLPAVSPTISGKTGLSLQLTGNGRSNAALLGSLTGSGVLSTGSLTISGLKPDGYVEMIARADAIGHNITPAQVRDIAEAAFFEGTTELPPTDYPVTVANGEIRIANTTAKADGLTVATSGAVRLTTGDVSGDVRLSLDPGPEAVAGPQPEVAMAFRPGDGGNGFMIDKDFGAVTGFLTQRALEQEQARVEGLQARLLEKQRMRREVQLYTYRKRIRLQELEESRLRTPADQRTEETAPQQEAATLGDAAATVAKRLSSGGPARSDATLLQVPNSGGAGGSAPQIIELGPNGIIRRQLQPVQ